MGLSLHLAEDNSKRFDTGLAEIAAELYREIQLKAGCNRLEGFDLLIRKAERSPKKDYLALITDDWSLTFCASRYGTNSPFEIGTFFCTYNYSQNHRDAVIDPCIEKLFGISQQDIQDFVGFYFLPDSFITPALVRKATNVEYRATLSHRDYLKNGRGKPSVVSANSLEQLAEHMRMKRARAIGKFVGFPLSGGAPEFSQETGGSV